MTRMPRDLRGSDLILIRVNPWHPCYPRSIFRVPTGLQLAASITISPTLGWRPFGWIHHARVVPVQFPGRVWPRSAATRARIAALPARLRRKPRSTPKASALARAAFAGRLRHARSTRAAGLRRQGESAARAVAQLFPERVASRKGRANHRPDTHHRLGAGYV